MSLVWCILLMLGGDQPEQRLLIPAYLRHPEVTWSDLNGDGILDIWVVEGSKKAPDQADRIWVHNGASSDDTLHELVYTPMAGDIRPVGEGEDFWVRTYHQGVVLDFHGEQGWLVHTDFNQLAMIRPGMEPINLLGGLLVPTFTGYQMLRGECIEADFAAYPTVEVSRDRLAMTWPMPHSLDLNGDGVHDLVAAPIRSPQHGEARIWYALRDGDEWREGSCRVQFPSGEDVADYRFGDLDGDGIAELVIVTRPAKDLSIFEEMGFVIYSGIKPGQWDPVPIQTLKTKQNLWQMGPLEVDTRGITFYYYKGLIRDKFRIDCFPWKDGFIGPNPESRMWKLKDAERGYINLEHDLNDDGKSDLVLNDARGLVVYFRRDGQIPYRDEPDLVLGDGTLYEGRSFALNIGDEGVAMRVEGTGGSLSGDRSSALISNGPGQKPTLWNLKQESSGNWSLSRLSLGQLGKN